MAIKKRENVEHKLSDEQKMFVCAGLAQGHSPERVVQDISDEYGIVVSRNNIRENYQNSSKWKGKIEKLRELYDKEILKHPLACKINRLNWLLQAINEAFIWRVDKIFFDKESGSMSKIMKRNIGVVAGLIREARCEVEGDRGIEVQNPVFIYLPKKDPLPK